MKEHVVSGFNASKAMSFASKTGGEFCVENRHSGGRSKLFDDEELEHLLSEDSCQSQKELARSLQVSQQVV